MDVVAKVRELITTAEIRRVEGVWPTHYHLDHNEMINRARQASARRSYVQREMLDITEHPYAYGLPYCARCRLPWTT